MDWKEILATGASALASVVSGSVVVLGLSTWLGRLWADRFLKDHTSKLDLLLREKTAALDRLTHVHNTRFSGVYAVQASTIAEIYKCLWKLKAQVNVLSVIKASGGHTVGLEERIREAQTSFTECLKLIGANRIYFSESLNDQFDQFLRHAEEVWRLDYHFAEELNRYDILEEHKVDLEALKLPSMSVRLEETLKQLVVEFRKLLGSEPLI